MVRRRSSNDCGQTTPLLLLVVQLLVTARLVSAKGWFKDPKGGNWREKVVNSNHPHRRRNHHPSAGRAAEMRVTQIWALDNHKGTLILVAIGSLTP